jgi:HAD superfamily hydrolase (TIGR01490 family)
VTVSIAFFDLDRTLLSQNSGTLWIRRELRLGHITRLQALRAIWWLTRYQLGVSSMEDALDEAISALAGSSAHAIKERTRAFYEQEVRGLYRRGARLALEHHRREGHQLVLLTASSSYLSDLVAAELQLDAVLCNRFEVDAQGLHTGKRSGALCFGAGKLEHAKAFAQQQGASLATCTFYTDSYFDVPVLLHVGRPVAVHPDRRLARLAVKKSWEIAHWGEPDAEREAALHPPATG